MVAVIRTLLATAGLLSSFSSVVLAADRGLAWGANDAWAPTIAKENLITWMHHWQDGPVAQMPSKVEWVPMNWGPKYANLWARRVSEMNCSLPNNILAFNEPDVPSQSNMTPLDAALAYIAQLEPYRQMGVQVSSPQIAFNFTWLDSFLTELRSRGSDVDFIAIHYYGAYNSLANAQAYVQKAWTKYKLPIWVTEIGTTASSGGTNAQVRQFMLDFLAWLDTMPYVKRAAWTGCYPLSSPPDSYISKYTSMFFSDGTLRQIGQQYACGALHVCTICPDAPPSFSTNAHVYHHHRCRHSYPGLCKARQSMRISHQRVCLWRGVSRCAPSR